MAAPSRLLLQRHALLACDSTEFQFIGEGAGGKSETLQASYRRYKRYLFDRASPPEGLHRWAESGGEEQ